MFSHVMVGVNDLEVSKKFYDALLGALGIGPGTGGKLLANAKVAGVAGVSLPAGATPI